MQGIKKKLVDLVGIEPTTSSMPWKRAPSCATGPLAVRGEPFNSRPCERLRQLWRLELEHVAQVTGHIVARVQAGQAPIPLDKSQNGDVVHLDVRNVTTLAEG